MNFIEFIILGLIVVTCLFYVVGYIIKPFRKKNKNFCSGCPYINDCKKYNYGDK